jgi:hypothetical protein
MSPAGWFCFIRNTNGILATQSIARNQNNVEVSERLRLPIRKGGHCHVTD